MCEMVIIKCTNSNYVNNYYVTREEAFFSIINYWLVIYKNYEQVFKSVASVNFYFILSS